MPLIAETERLKIQTWEQTDVEKLMHLTTLDGISEFSISGYSHFSKEHAAKWIQKEQERFAKYKLGKFAVILKETNTPIGISGLFQMPIDPTDKKHVPHSVELNYRYPKQYRGKGYALEASKALLGYGFNALLLSEIYANVDLTNIASQKILTRLNMQRIGDITYEGIKAGRWCIKRGNL